MGEAPVVVNLIMVEFLQAVVEAALETVAVQQVALVHLQLVVKEPAVVEEEAVIPAEAEVVPVDMGLVQQAEHPVQLTVAMVEAVLLEHPTVYPVEAVEDFIPMVALE
jgi:hypothetical protein